MYRIIDVSIDNCDDYTYFLGEDVAENIGREYYRGIVAVSETNSQVAGGMVWVLKNLETRADTESNIVFIKADDDEAVPVLMEGYKKRIRDDKVTFSHAYIPTKEGKGLKALLKQEGSNMRLFESDVIIVKLSELSEMPFIKKLRKSKIPESIMPLNQVVLKSFRDGIRRCISQGRTGLCDDLESLGIHWFEEDVSCVSVNESGINGFFLFHQRPSGIIAVQLLVCLDQSFRTTLPELMCKFVTLMEEKYSPDTKIEFDRHNEQSLLLSEKLLPRGFGIPIYVGSRRE